MVLISSEQVFCWQEGDLTSVRSAASLHSLAAVMRGCTVWFGIHAICSSLMSPNKISGFWSSVSFKQLSLGVVWSHQQLKSPSLAFIRWLQILCVHFNGLFWLSFSSFFLLERVSAMTLQEAFSCWCSAAACRAAAKQLCWSHMAVFAWWGFIALKMPKNVS